MYKKILVATDGSALSKKAVTSAIELAALTGAELVALKVVPRCPQSYFEGGLALQAAEIGRVEKQWAEDGQAIVDAVPIVMQWPILRLIQLSANSHSSWVIFPVFMSSSNSI